ncbi:hypothetical protein EG329_011810 [Mollisiaceae sp. DMI_Dod_QoI]|nr:hypothetical protein EG329_011810 [Helotiales sp. DMI_Dod_QoI]
MPTMWFPTATALWLVFGLPTIVYAQDALATFSPCPDCPSSIAQRPITITAQYQTVSTCTPQETCTSATCPPQETCTSTTCFLTPSCSTYAWVSTTVPALGGATSTLITKTDQVLELSHASTVLTSSAPCTTTAAPFFNATTPSNGTTTLNNTQTACTSTIYHTLVVDISAPFDETGPLAIPGWNGSGLCNACVPNANTLLQVVDVDSCLDGTCSTFKETWISTKQTTTPSSSVVTTPFTTSYPVTSGVNTVPITATFSPPQDTRFTAPVTSTFPVTTSVPSPQVVVFTTFVTVTFAAGPAAAAIQTIVSGTTRNSPAIVAAGSLTLNPNPGAASTPAGAPGSPPFSVSSAFSQSPNGPSAVPLPEGSPGSVLLSVSVTASENPSIPSATSTPEDGSGSGSPPLSVSPQPSQSPGTQTVTSALGDGSGSGSPPVSASSQLSQSLTGVNTASTLGGTGTGTTSSPFSATVTSSQSLSSQSTISASGSSSPTLSTGLSSSQSLSGSSSSNTVSTGLSSISTTSTASTTGSTTGGSSSTGSTGVPGSTTAGSSSTTASGSSSITVAPSVVPTSPPVGSVVGTFEYFGCVGSTNGFPTFSLAGSSSAMSVDLCLSECGASGELYAGLFSTDCYCASTLDGGSGGQITTGVCDIPCPGNPSQSCGGSTGSSGKLRRRIAAGILLDVYENNAATTTTSSSSTETSSTTSSTPDPSSDPDPEPQKRDLQDEMETSHYKAHSGGKLRRGGMLQIAKPVNGPALAKRDYGIKAPFGS